MIVKLTDKKGETLFEAHLWCLILHLQFSGQFTFPNLVLEETELFANGVFIPVPANLDEDWNG